MRWIEGIPSKLGYRMPGEFERQNAVWLAWPHNEETFYGPENVKAVEHIYVMNIAALHSGQNVHLLVKDRAMKKRVENILVSAGISMDKIHLHEIPTVDVWIRDYGPTFVVNPAAKEPLAMVKWTFNAWGNKYDDLAMDDRVPFAMQAKAFDVPAFDPGIVLEGGSIDSNGQGCLLTTEQCLLNPNRNPSLSKEQIEQKLKDYLGVKKVLWLGQGIAGDDTDGHVDDIARFTSPNTIACAYEDDSSDENHDVLAENHERLTRMTDVNGDPFTIVKIPMPGKVMINDTRLPASYLNFYVGNDAVTVPIFGHENDAKAIEILKGLFPTRKVMGIECTKLVYGLGTLHCSSQQEPVPRF
ncbi:MAG: agmatine/peptidylarginine deiminase [Candidatus Sigynarchaeota archaeon]